MNGHTIMIDGLHDLFEASFGGAWSPIIIALVSKVVIVLWTSGMFSSAPLEVIMPRIGK